MLFMKGQSVVAVGIVEAELLVEVEEEDPDSVEIVGLVVVDGRGELFVG